MAKHASEYRGARENAKRSRRAQALKAIRLRFGLSISQFDKAKHAASQYAAQVQAEQEARGIDQQR